MNDSKESFLKLSPPSMVEGLHKYLKGKFNWISVSTMGSLQYELTIRKFYF